MATLEDLYSFAGGLSKEESDLFRDTFLKYQSDKSGYHNYHELYSALYKNRDGVVNVLEMGIHMGASLRAWRELFPNANVIGLENNINRFFSEKRILSMYVDQSLLHTFDMFLSVMMGTEFDFIVDDGSHYLQETKNTFYKLLPVLKIGGWFVVEDIKSEFENEWETISDQLPNNYERFLINMNSLAKTNSNDNIMLAVKRIS